jgi:hypothetical protein
MGSDLGLIGRFAPQSRTNANDNVIEGRPSLSRFEIACTRSVGWLPSPLAMLGQTVGAIGPANQGAQLRPLGIDAGLGRSWRHPAPQHHVESNSPQIATRKVAGQPHPAGLPL